MKTFFVSGAIQDRNSGINTLDIEFKKLYSILSSGNQFNDLQGYDNKFLEKVLDMWGLRWPTIWENTALFLIFNGDFTSMFHLT